MIAEPGRLDGRLLPLLQSQHGPKYLPALLLFLFPLGRNRDGRHGRGCAAQLEGVRGARREEQVGGAGAGGAGHGDMGAAAEEAVGCGREKNDLLMIK